LGEEDGEDGMGTGTGFVHVGGCHSSKKINQIY